MGFALPWALIGLLAASIPVLVHLMRRRDMREIALPTIALLHRARVHSRRRMRLVDILLLAARIALFLLVALAVAQPYFSVTLAWGDGSVASAVVVIDDSMSMGRTDGGDTLLATARERALEAVEALPEGSEVAVVLAGSPARTLVARNGDRGLVRRRLGSIPDRTARGTDLREAIRLGMRELSRARHPTRRMLVLSDFAQHARADAVAWPEAEVELRLERIGDGEPVPNRAVAEAIAVPHPTKEGRASVRVTLRGFDADDDAVTARLLRDGEEIARTDTALADGAARFTLRAPLVREGNPAARLVLEDEDALPVDDERGVLLRPPTAANVLLVNGDPHGSRLEDEVAFVAQALDAAPRDEGSVAYRIVDPDTLGAQSLSDTDVVVMANVPAPTPTVARKLRSFVADGGGLLITGGDRVEPRTWAGRMDEVLPAHPGAAMAGQSWKGLRAEGSADESAAASGLGNVTTRRRLTLDAADADASTWLSFGDGAPALVVGPHGDGRVAMLATTLDDDWTDLPYRPGFLPLLMRVITQLAPTARMPQHAFSPGETVTVPVPPGARLVRVIDPEGRRHDFEDPGDTVELEQTEVPGPYRVLVATRERPAQDEPRAAFVVAPPTEESDLGPGELPQVGQSGDRQAASGGTVRRPLGPWLWLLAGLLIVAEGLLRTRWRGRRTETSPA